MAQSRHVTKNSAVQWLVSAAIGLAIFWFFMWYHAVRGKPCCVFTANKCIAIASTFCIGLALALGPLARMFARLDAWLPYRRTLGLTGAYAILAHLALSLFVLNEKFPLKWYGDYWLCAVFGAAAFVLLAAITIHSYPSGVKRLGRDRWVGLQKLAWIGMVLVLGHVLLLGKAPGWVKWLRTFNKPLPPGAFTTSCFCALVLALKVVDVMRGKGRDEGSEMSDQG